MNVPKKIKRAEPKPLRPVVVLSNKFIAWHFLIILSPGLHDHLNALKHVEMYELL